MKSLFIGALPFRADEKRIRELILPYGPEENIQIFADWINPHFEPYALVRVKDVDRAIAELDGLKIGSTHLRVHEWSGI
ncbi:MAG: RNA-binding protein [Deltaproteobacteria bacterium]|nr:RNA-binding protein [Deltaproteobacteria bacterium]